MKHPQATSTNAQLWIVDAIGGLNDNKIVIVDVEVIDRGQPPRSGRHGDIGLPHTEEPRPFSSNASRPD